VRFLAFVFLNSTFDEKSAMSEIFVFFIRFFKRLSYADFLSSLCGDVIHITFTFIHFFSKSLMFFFLEFLRVIFLICSNLIPSSGELVTSVSKHLEKKSKNRKVLLKSNLTGFVGN
jgi:hypothetical protein